MADRTYGEYGFYIEPLRNNLGVTLDMWKAHWSEQKEDDLRGVKFNPYVAGFVDAEAKGNFQYITVRWHGELVGHFGLSFGTNKNTSQRVSGDDFFYIKPEHRKGMLGIKLIKFARDVAFECGAEEFSISYRVTVDDLEPVMRRCGMKRIAYVHSIRR